MAGESPGRPPGIQEIDPEYVPGQDHDGLHAMPLADLVDIDNQDEDMNLPPPATGYEPKRA